MKRAGKIKGKKSAKPSPAIMAKVMKKIKGAKLSNEKDIDVKGGKVKKKASKMFLKSGGKGNMKNCKM